MSLNKKTLEEHIDYLEETVKLCLWVAADRKNRHPNEDFIWILHERTCLVNHTIFNPKSLYDFPTYEGPEWPQMRYKLRSLYEDDSSPEIFEKRGFELLKPYISPRAEDDLTALNTRDESDPFAKTWIRYDLTKKDDPMGYIEIHMANSLYPHSFLGDKEYFNSKLIEAIKDIESNGFKGIWTKSWLNEHPVWQNLMPDEWNNSITKREWDIEWHLGFWGQFLTSNQCFNKKLGEKYRKDGKLPYPMSTARASLKAFKELLCLK